MNAFEAIVLRHLLFDNELRGTIMGMVRAMNEDPRGSDEEDFGHSLRECFCSDWFEEQVENLEAELRFWIVEEKPGDWSPEFMSQVDFKYLAWALATEDGDIAKAMDDDCFKAMRTKDTVYFKTLKWFQALPETPKPQLVLLGTRINGQETLQYDKPNALPEVQGKEPGADAHREQMNQVGGVVNGLLDKAERSAQKVIDAFDRAYPEGK